MAYTRSANLYKEALKHIPGGVNSPVRAFYQVGGTPIFMKYAEGAYVFDEDGNKYIDYINSWGPMILGHGHPSVVHAVQQQAKSAFSFGTPTSLEIEIAKLIKTMVPNIEMVRMVNSGTEACMSAIRVARGFTGRVKILKFEGHYHGHSDVFLKKAGSGLASLGILQSDGVPTAVTNDTVIIPFNNFAILEETIERYKKDLAAIILEPVAGNMGCVPPKEGYLQLLRKLCTTNNIVLIFDEVMTGFRLARGGAQEAFQVWADLVAFGKIIGGGLPVGAFGGRSDIMSCIAPLGNVYQAGTLSGSPLAMVAGIATLTELNTNPEIYSSLNEKGQFLSKKLSDIFHKKKIPASINQIGSMISVHFCKEGVLDFEMAKSSNNHVFKKFFHHMLSNGIYLPPSPYESWFLSLSLSMNDLENTLNAVESFNS